MIEKIIEQGLITIGQKILNESSLEIKKESQGTIDEYLKNKSIEIDEFVKRTEISKGNKCAGGEIIISIDGEKNFIFSGEFYFTTTEKTWMKETIKSASTPMDWHFTELEIKNIVANKKLKFSYYR